MAGVGNTASNVRSSAFGYGNIASGEKSSAFGYNNKASGRESLAFGHWNEANGNQSSVFGHGNLTNGFATSAFGYGNSADKEGSSAFGYNNTASGEWSSAFGTQNQANGKRSSVFGNQYKVTGEASGAFGVGKTTWNSTTGKDDYDYVNEGKDSYMIGNYNRIASGSNNNFILGNNVSIGSGIQNSVALGNGSTVSSSNEVSVGSATQKRKITNVADGEVSATSTDAVNGRQLYNAMQNSNNTFKNEVNEKIDNVKNEVRNVGSLSAALAGLHPMQYDPKAPTQVMAALGHYKNKQAVAIGASYYFNDRFMMSTGIALSGEKRTETMANVGFTIKLGKGSGVAYNETPQYVVQNEVKRLTVENQELKEKVNAQGAENKDLKERVQKLEEKLNKLLTTK
ncbi:YadA-like family protein [Fusobacterium nucleatum]|uniref:YadA-like family protein n=1 Tax=Fusobacterium nucleatum TaxID=851 RepID=UPI0001C59C35